MQQKHRPYNYTTEYFTEQPCYNRTDSQLYSRIFYNKAMLQSIQSTSKYFIVQSFTNTKTLQSTPKYFTVKPFYKSADPIIKHKTIIKLYLENRRHICAENLDKNFNFCGNFDEENISKKWQINMKMDDKNPKSTH